MFERFKQRSYELERLDTGDYTAEEYSRWQREMLWVHRFWGEERAIKNSLLLDANSLENVSVLDVGAGSGGILKFIKRELNGRTRLLAAGELSDEALATVKAESSTTGIAPIKCNALHLPFADGSFDYTITTLFLHHLVDEDAIRLIKEISRVSTRRFYIVDLNRHPVGYYAYRVLSPIFLQKFTQEDGALSILRSFTSSEMLDLAEKAGVTNAKVEHSRANRLILSGK